MEHYHQGNAYALCANYEDSIAAISRLNHEDIEIIRRLPSFRPYIESLTNCKEVIAMLTDDEFMQQRLEEKLIPDVHRYLHYFHCFIRALMTLVQDLPKNLLGNKVCFYEIKFSIVFFLNIFSASWFLCDLCKYVCCCNCRVQGVLAAVIIHVKRWARWPTGEGRDNIRIICRNVLSRQWNRHGMLSNYTIS